MRPKATREASRSESQSRRCTTAAPDRAYDGERGDMDFRHPGIIVIVVMCALLRSGPRYDIGSGKLLVLLQQAPLQEELGVSSPQQAELTKWAEVLYERDLPTDTLLKEVAERFRLPEKKRERLEEIRLQILGGHALLLDEGLAEKLKISKEQEAELARLRERNNSDFRKLARELDALRFDSLDAKEKYKDPTRIKTGDRLLGVLNSDQRAEFRRR